MPAGSLDTVIALAIARLIAAQAPAGCFRDFELGMGTSGPWVTAAIGLRLATLPPAYANEQVAAAVRRVHAYLRADPPPPWSYNELVPPDADTTAHVLAFLEAVGDRDLGGARRLARFQTADGGFATFLPESDGANFPSWLRSHPDVTPVALRALAPYREDAAIDEVIGHGLARLAGARERGWPAFWWALAWYTPAMWSAACAALGVPFALEPPAAPPYLETWLDAAYLLELARRQGWHELAAHQASELVAAAQPDGSWPTSPVLRVTLPDVDEPWRLAPADGGELYADVRGLYSTAVIASALAHHAAASRPR